MFRCFLSKYVLLDFSLAFWDSPVLKICFFFSICFSMLEISYTLFLQHLQQSLCKFYLFSHEQWSCLYPCKKALHFQYLQQCLCKYHLFSLEQRSCLYPYKKVLHFHYISILFNYAGIHTSQFYIDLVLIILNKQAYS